MPHTLEGDLVVDGARFGIVVSRFNGLLTEQLLEGALDALRRHGAEMDRVTIARCPGAVEVPLVAERLAASGKVDAVITLGAVIRGDTYHFEVVAGEASRAGEVALRHGVPVSFGVLTTESIEQTIARSGTKAGNKGAEAALAAIETVNLLAAIDDWAADDA